MTKSGDWRRYVATLCGDAWELTPDATAQIMEGIERLIASEQVTDSAVARVLREAGVRSTALDLTALSIRVVVRATSGE
jgi:hypothetical protein